MFKLILLIPKRPELTNEEFRNHYELNHVPLGMRLIGHLIKSYTRNYVVDAINYSKTGDPQTEYTAVTEICFKDSSGFAEFERIINLSENQGVLEEDEKRFFDRSKVRMLIVDAVTSD